MGREAWSVLASIATVASLAAPSPASAATVEVGGRAVTYTAAPGERNDVGLYLAPGRVQVADRIPITAGAGCAATPSTTDRYEVACALPFGEPSVTIRTLDRDDSVLVKPVAFPPGAGVTRMTVDGGTGQDWLAVFQDIQGPVYLRGGGGADYVDAAGPQLRVAGDSGNDVIFARATPLVGVVTDVGRLSGGSGDDTLAVPPAGPIGARPSSSERLTGGSGDDLLFGSDGIDAIYGGAGADRIGGFSAGELNQRLRRSKNRHARSSTVFSGRSRYLEVGTDVLIGDKGNDRIRGDLGNDIVSGGPGNDTLAGGSDPDLIAGGGGRDLLTGGPGNDALFGGAGADTLRGEAGRDTLITADDKQRDAVADCGRGKSDRLVGGIADFSRLFAARHQFRITQLRKGGTLPPAGYPVPRSAVATLHLQPVGARIVGCERLAIAP